MQLTGMKGIPRKIINKKLEYLEKEVNGILSKFINKNIYITKEIDDILVKRFSQFGLYKDFETLMRVATKFYNENDEITTFDYLLQKNI